LQMSNKSSEPPLVLSFWHTAVNVFMWDIVPSPLQLARVEYACYALLPSFRSNEDRRIRCIIRWLLRHRGVIWLLWLCLMTIVMVRLLLQNGLRSARWIHRRIGLRCLRWRYILGSWRQHGYARWRGLRMTAWRSHGRLWDGKRRVPLVNEGGGVPLHVVWHGNRIVIWHLAVWRCKRLGVLRRICPRIAGPGRYWWSEGLRRAWDMPRILVLRICWNLQIVILAIQGGTRLVWFRGAPVRERGLQLEGFVDIGREGDS
jgi:hypothetical protein